MLLGVITSTFGGLKRDVLCNEIPLILRIEIYAIACLFGAAVYLFGDYLGFIGDTWLLLLGVVIITIRTLAIINSWKMPLIKELDQHTNK